MNSAASPNPGASRFADLFAGIDSMRRAAQRTAEPLVDLGVRLWLARIFVVSAILKLAQWDNALALARYEYPVSWLDPVTAAWLGVAVELFGGLLLALGLATRAAAMALLALTLVVQFSYRSLDVHAFWIALFAWYAVRGAGALSLDRAIASGLAESPLPFARPVSNALAAVTRLATPVFMLAVRCAIGYALIAGIGAARLSAMLPDPAVTRVVTIVGALLLAAGLLTRPVSIVCALLFAASVMMHGEGSIGGYWMLAFGLLALLGAGPLSLDALAMRRLKARFPQLDGKPAFSLDGLPHVVIVGAGFGGITCAQALARTPVRVTLIDRHNYHLFQPLLYQVATTALSPGDIAMPIRGLFRDQFNARVLLGNVTGIDPAQRQVHIGAQRIGYDYLVLATGAAHSYFGRDDWAPFAPGLKRVEDATEVRRRLLSAFERAELTEDPEERRRLLTFLIVGAGPTGVELAGSIAELARFGMQKEFRSFDPASARVILVQSGPRVLPTFPEELSLRTLASLENLGVEVAVDSKVQAIDELGVTINGKRVESRTVLWAAGVVASPAAEWIGADKDSAGRLKVGGDLSVPGAANVFAIGDTASSTSWEGRPVPGLAPAAKQGGTYVARLIRAKVLRKPGPGPFRYRHMGSLATIGRKSAVADLGFAKLWGAPAWWLWGAIHVSFLVGVRNRVSVLLDWVWSYLTFQSGTRLITGGPDPMAAALPPPAASAQPAVSVSPAADPAVLPRALAA